MTGRFDTPEGGPGTAGIGGPLRNPGKSRQSRLPIFVVGLGLAAWTAIALVRVLPYLPTSGGDFEHFHRSAAALVAGESAYSSPDFDYPPLVPVLLAPLGLLPLAEARMAWLAISLAALLVAAWATWRLAGGDLTASVALLAVVALEGTAIPNLGLGQSNPLLLALVAVALLLVGSQPARAAASVGFAAALKLWPGMLLLAWLPLAGRSRAGLVAALRCALVGLGVWALGIVLPAALLTFATAPPHVALAHGFWLGTPALLNFSAPAAVLRASYGWVAGAPLPADWEAGVRASWALAHDLQLLSAGVSVLVLTAGLLAIAWRLGRVRRAASAKPAALAASARDTARDTVCALIALALLAAPISWYHYQLLQLPAFVLAFATAVRARRWGRAALVVVAVLALTRHELVVSLVQTLESDSTTALYRTGFLVPIFAAIWFATRVHRIGANGGQPELP